MKPTGTTGLFETQPASPSAVGPTRTSEPRQPRAAGPAPADAPPPAGPKLRDRERYRVLGEHGRGGLGRVLRAHDVELGRDIAVKELISRGPVGEIRFLREALITARLEHPGIVPVYEAGRWADGTPFYAMKLVAGRSLRDLLAERTTIDERIALLHHVIAVADAMAYAHDRNIIHRDLKPANVIVGDFGETVVIDWGLAKDLAATEEAAVGGRPFPAHRDDGLTSAGAVLGTPAYMAPEQERGEPVDQCADVFAIGAMLWELCALQRRPPGHSGERLRILRRAGIDQDLAAIIDKAVDSVPERRYPDAGALAADLKAFKAGARIAARRYSLWALLAHWIRRHRALAISAAGVAGLAAAGIALYIRTIAVERDRADRSEVSATRARASAEASLDELTLKHAELLLATDPSAAIDALAGYRGADVDRARQIRAEATGRGVAILRAAPHSDMACWAEGMVDGSVISLGTDGAIAQTTRGGASTVVARGVADLGQSAYARARHLLAYACDPADVCLRDLARDAVVPVAAALRGANAAAMAFSPAGTLLALMARGGALTVLDVTDPARPSPRLALATRGGTDVKFLDDDTVAVHDAAGLSFVRMDRATASFAVPGNSYWDADPASHRFATATTRGQALVFEGAPLGIAARADLCHGPVTGLQFLPGRRSLAYACRDGAVGIWDPRDGTVAPRMQLEGHAELLAVSPSGEHLIAAGGNRAVTVLDLTTDLVTRYQGHKFRLLSITPPTPEFPFVISTDVSGALRTWPLPARLARVAATVDSPLHTAIFAGGPGATTRVIATSYHPALTALSLPVAGSTGAGEPVESVGPHEIYNIFLEQAVRDTSFVAYGFNDHIEFWSSAPLTRTAAIHTRQGTVSQLHFAGNADKVIVSGHDGRLMRWASSGQATLLAKIDQPIIGFAHAAATGAIVFGSSDGALWRTGAEDGDRPIALAPGGSRIARLLALPDQRTVYGGYASGDVIAIDTASWKQALVLHVEEAVQDIATTPDGQILAITTHDAIYVGTRTGNGVALGQWNWSQLRIRARQPALARDGLLVALATDGIIWIYAVRERRWLCLPAGTTDLRRVTITADGSAAVVLDVEGRLIWIDLAAARRRLELAS